MVVASCVVPPNGIAILTCGIDPLEVGMVRPWVWLFDVGIACKVLTSKPYGNLAPFDKKFG